MSSSSGWVKLHRKLLDNPRFKDGDWLKIWMFLLSSATHKERDIIFAGERMTLKPGELITSRKSIVEKTGVEPSKVERVLKMMKSEHQIDQRSDNRCRLVSVTSWDEYQVSEHANEHPVNIQRTSSEHPVNTHKNDKNEKNVYGGTLAHLDEEELFRFANSEFPNLSDRKSLAIEFHSIYSVQDWRTQGANPINLLESGRWKHKFKSFVMDRARTGSNGQPKERDYSPKKLL